MPPDITVVGRCGNKWRAFIRVNGKQKHLGVFATKEAACEARRTAEFVHYGQYVRVEHAPITANC